MHRHNCAQTSWAGKTCGKVYSVSLVLCNRDKATRPSGAEFSRAETKRHCSDTQLRATPANRGSTASFSFEGCCCHYSIHHWHMPWHERTCLTCVHNFNRPKTLVASAELQGTTKTDDANRTGKWDRFLYSFIRIHTLLLVAKNGSMALHISQVKKLWWKNFELLYTAVLWRLLEPVHSTSFYINCMCQYCCVFMLKLNRKFALSSSCLETCCHTFSQVNVPCD